MVEEYFLLECAVRLHMFDEAKQFHLLHMEAALEVVVVRKWRLDSSN